MKKMMCKPATMDAVKEKNAAVSGSNKAAAKKKKTPPSEEPSNEIKPSSGIGTLVALEPRIMFDGAALATGAEVIQDTTTQDQTTIPGIDGENSPDSTNADSSDSDAFWSSGLSLTAPSDQKEIVFIDTRVEDFQTLVEGIDPNAEVILLDSTRDGIEQIAEIMAERSDIDAIHLIAEGNEAELHLGTTFLTQDAISGQYASLFTQIGQSLSAEADLLIYGCNFGQGEAGQDAMESLAALTGADTAASTDRTGHVSEYANWELEVATGTIETSIVIGETTQEAWEGVLAIYTVTSTADNPGSGTLRWAINQANANAGTDTIAFSIAGAGPHTIALGSALPTITEAVLIDGWSEPDFAGTPVIELDGTGAGAGVDGLVIGGTGGGSTIRGLSIQNFDHNGILLQGGNNIIAGNYLGLAADGTTVAGNNIAGTGIQGGIRIESANNTIGGLTAADRNVISGNTFSGIALAGAGATGNQVLGNYIGLDAGGTLDRGNTQEGIEIDGADGNTIGGSTAGARNVISGNDSDGMEIDNGDNNIIQGNYIGTDYTGTFDLGNTRDGIDLNENTGNGATGNLIGGTGANEGNLIYGNDMNGVEVRDNPTTGNSILGNQIYGNGLLGIDLGIGNDGVTANDGGDGDTGANSLQNFPVVTSAVTTGTQITIGGTLNTDGLNQAYRIEFFWNPTGDASGNGEGAGFLGATSVTTDGSGNATFSGVVFTEPIAVGADITATATVDLGGGNYGDTSEFAANFAATGGSTLVVETTSDVIDGTTTSIAALLAARGADGVISLREAITAANNTAGTDTIYFNITEPLIGGAHTINVGSVLPTITEAVLIDGWSEPDFASTPVIRIDGASAGAGVDGLSFNGTSDGSTVRGLIITTFTQDGILVQSGADNITIAGNWIGTTGTGSTGVGNGDDGVEIVGSNAIIGGTGANDRNVITNNGDEGIQFGGSGVTGHLVQGNYIGVDPDGSTGGGNTDVGIAIISGSGNTIGGTTAAARNVISKNKEGIEINTDNNVVQGNYIGTDAGGTLDRGNISDDGVEIQSGATGNLIGGTAVGAGNLIAFNTLDGVHIANGSSNSVLGNQIHSNSGLGIDLGPNGVTGNDAGDGDTGANNLQNFAVLTTADVDSPTEVTIDGTFNSTASTTFRIEFYKNTIATGEDPSNHGEGETYLGFTTVTTDGSGNGTFNTTLTASVTAGEFVTATATEDLGGGNYGSTSEFALNVTATAVNDAPVVGAPGAPLAATEQTNLSIEGTGFTVSDVDEAAGGTTTTLTVGEGILTVVVGDSGVTIVSGDGTGTVVLSGTITQIDNLLTGTSTGTITYLNSSDTPSASTTLTVTVNDEGNTGTDPGLTGDGTSEEGTNNVTINVTAVNDAPVVGAPGAPLAATEQTNLSIEGTGFTVSDVDEAAGGTTTTLTVGEGILTVVVGDSGVTIVSGDGTGTVVLSGTITQIDNLLTGTSTGTITYLNSSDTPSASTTLTVTVNDEGNTGTDPGLTGDGTSEEGTNNVTINVTAVNDAPVVGAPGAPLAATEQTNLSIEGTGFTVSDVDEAAGGTTTTLTVGEGILTVVVGDSGVTIVSGDGTGTVVLSGTITQIDNLLTGTSTGTITYLNSSDTPSASTTLTVTVNDEGNTGTDPGLTGDGTSEEGTNNVTINVTAVNDAPVVGAPGAPLAATEQTNLSIEGTGFTVSDVDEAAGGTTTTLTVGEGILTVVVGDSGVTIVSGDGTGTVVLSGTITQIDNLLTGTSTGTITYLNSSDTPSASTTLTVTVNDEGNTGTDPGLTGDGTSEEGTNNVTINVTAVNDAPVVGAPGAPLAATEQTNLSIEGTGFTVSDVDEAAGGTTTTLTVGEGILTVVVGDSGVTIVSGDGTGTVVLSGTITQIDNLLTGTSTGTITYLNSSDTPSASTTLTVTVNDEGNTGTDPGLTGDGTSEEGTNNVTINVTAVNDAPVVGAPGAPLAATEQTNLSIEGTGFTVSDVDEAAGGTTTTLTVGEGILTVVVGDSGVTIVSGDGTGTVVLSGTITQIDNLLTGTSTGTITYLNSSDTPSASTTLTVTVNDEGNTGTDPGLTGDGTSEEGTNNVTINVTAVNDAPVVGAPGAPLAATEQTNLSIEGTGFTVSDVDEAAGGTTTTLTVGEGILTVVVGDSGVTIVSGDGTGTVVLSGTITQIDNLLTGTSTGTITYLNSSDTPSASTTLTVTVNDEGNTGTDPGLTGDGTSEEGTNNVTINVTAVNDAPVVGAPGAPLAATEQTNLSIEGTGFTVSDVDEAAGGTTTTLTVGEGILTVVVGDSGVTIVSGDGTGTVVLSGTITQIDNLLTGTSTGTITYLNSSDTPSASTTLTVTVNDEGNTGTDPGLTGDGTSEEGTNNVTINVTAVNDAPVVGAPGAPLAATEQTNLSIEGTGFTVSDVDEAAGGTTTTLTVGEGILTVVVGDSGVTIVSGDGTGTVVLSGTITQIDNLLTGTSTGTITYLNSSDTPSASTTLTVTVNDEGNTGTDPGLTGDGTSEEGTNNVTINVTAVNDAPVVGAPGAPLAATEQTNLSIEGTGFTVSDVDEAAGGTTTTLTVGEGILTVVVGDSGVTIVSGDGTGTVVLSGTITQIDNLLTGTSTGTITYLNSSDTPSASTTLTVTVNDEGNTGTDPGLTGDGTSEEGTNNVTINVTAVNDAPVVGAPGAPLAATEQTNLSIEGTGFTVSDVDEAAGGTTTTLTVGEGILTVVVGDSGVTIVSGDGTGTVVLSGTITQIDNLLTGTSTGTITYLNSSDTPSASTTLTVTVNDEGNTGTDPGLTGDGTSEEGTNNVTINVTAVNDAPVVGAPGAPLAATEQTNLSIEGTGFTVSDVDEAAGGTTTTLTVGEGILTVVVGDSGVTIVSGDGTGTVVLSGTITQIDNLLTGTSTGTITYLNSSDTPSASTTLTVTVNDEGNTGTDPGLTGDGTSEEGTNNVTINVTAVNDAPVVGAPGAPLAATEQTNLSIEGTGFTVSDVDEAAGGTTTTLTVGEGILTVVVGDSGVTIVSGDGTGTVVLSGTITQIDNLLTGTSTGTITYLNSSDTPSASTTLTVTVNDEGNTGTDPGLTGDGTSEEGTNNVTINVTAVNDAPVVGAPGAPLAATEQTNLSIEGTGFTVSDVDEAAGGTTTTLTVGEGILTVVVGDSGVTIVSGDGTGTVVLSGTITQIDNLLTGTSTGTITYLNSSDTPSASTTLTVTVNDEGNTGTDPGLTGDGTSEEGTNNVTINVTAVNDAPVVGAPGAPLAATEQTNLSIEGTGFTVSDVDEAAGGTTTTLTVGEGILTVVVGDSGVTIVSGDGTGTVVLSGTITQIDNLLTGTSTGTITYLNSSDTPSASTTLTVTVNDEGNTGTDPGLTGDGTSEEGTNNVTINVTAVNDAPVVGAPGAPLAATEQTNLSIEGTGFTVSDVDEAAGGTTTTLTVGEGILTVVVGDSGVTIVSGDGTGTVVLSGTITQIDNLLTGTSTGTITYLNSSDTPSASTTLTVTVNDEGNTGTDPGLTGDGTSEEGTNNVTINVTAVNDAPVVGAPGAPLAATEQTNLSIEGTGFTVSDVDEAAGGTTTTLTVGEGILTVVVGDSGVTIVSGDGTGTVVLSGTITQIDNLLTGTSTGTITYLNSSDTPSASTTLTVTVNDEGNTGTDPGLTGDGTSEEGTNNVTINVTAVNDAPVVGAPGAPLAATEQTNLSIEGTGFTVSDVDEAAGGTTTTLTVGEGILTVVVGDSGVTIVSGDGTGTVVLSGTITQIDNLLTGTSTGTITYLNSSDTPSASTTLTVTVNDEGNTGTDPGLTGDGTSEEGTNNVTINVTAVNDAPVVGAPGAPLAATEQTNLSIEGTGFTVSDVDEAAGGTTTTLTVGEGILTVVVGDSGVTIVSGDGTGTVVLSGTITQIDNLLTGTSTGTITYLNSSDTPSASTTLTVTVNDEGNTGTDPGLTGDGTSEEGTNNVTINVTAVNDAPVVGAPGAPLAATEQTNLSIEGTGFTVSDVDEAAGGTTTTLTVGEGILTVVVGDSGVTIVSGDGTGTVVLSGTITQIDNLLTGTSTGTITYLNSSDTPSASTTLTVTVNDEGNTGTDPGLTGDGTSEEGTNNVTINVTAVNDAPVVGAPGAPLAATEQTNLSIEGTGFTVSDVDEAAGGTTTTLTVGEGILTVVVGDSGVTIVSGDGTGTVVLSGTITQIDNLLTGTSTGTITYLNSSDTPSASTTLTVTVNDEGNTGTDPGLTGDGTSEEGTNNVTINVTAVNDAPVVGAPGAPLAATEQTNLSIEGTGFTVSDVDEAAGGTTTTLTVGEGILTVVVGDSGVTIVSGDGTGTVVLSGTITQIDNLLTGTSTGTITYLNSSDTPSASTTLTVTVNDEGNTGTDPGLTGDGTSEEGTNNVTINVTAVNDAPVVGAPGAPLAATEQTNLSIEGTGFTVSDVDEAAGGTTTTLTVGEGILTVVVGDSGVTIVSGDGTGTVVLSGTITQIDNLLTGTSTGTITYLNSSDTPSASTTLTVTVNDEGNTGTDPGLTGDGTSEEGTNNVTINVTAVNDAPVVGANNGSTVAEGGTDTITVAELQVTDVDNTPAQLTYTVTAVPINGQLELTTNLGVAITSFTQDDIDNNRLVYVHNASETTSDSFDFTVNDGAGGSIGGTTFALTITPVNDAPVITSNGGGATVSINATENQTNVTTVTATDVDLPPDTLTFSITGGADAALFSVNASSGVLTFNTAPDFEAPSDANTDGVYEVTVQVDDGNGGTDTQSLAITATDLQDGLPQLPPPPPPPSPEPLPEPRPAPDPVSDPDLPGPSLNGYGENGGFGRVPEEDDYLVSNREFGDVLDLPPFLRPASWATTGDQIRAYYGDPLDMTKTELSPEFLQQLNQFSDELGQAMEEQAGGLSLLVDMVKGTALAFSAGFVAWLVRGGALVAGLLASLPAWRHFDPVPILGMTKQEKKSWTLLAEEAAKMEVREHHGLEQILQPGPKPPSASSESTTKSL